MSTSTATTVHAASPERTHGAARRRTSWAISGLVGAFLAVDAGSHLLNVQMVQDWNAEHGAPDWFGYACGIGLAIGLIAYFVPRTAMLGATLLTGYFGGAMAVGLFLEVPAFNIVFAFAMSFLMWGALWLRDDRVKALYTV